MSEKNHYIPIFYQKRWAGPDGRVCVYSRPHNSAHVQRKHPAGVGYERDLYTVANVDKAISTYLEGTFFKTTDNLASIALAIIEGGQSQWSTFDVETRSAWTRFIISLLYRNPEQIKRLIEIVSRFIELTKPCYEREYQKLVDADRSFDDFWFERSHSIIAKSWIRLTQKTIDSKTVGTHFNNLIWRVIDLKSTYTLLTERPTDHYDERNERAWIASQYPHWP
jgi:hypothetical protein